MYVSYSIFHLINFCRSFSLQIVIFITPKRLSFLSKMTLLFFLMPVILFYSVKNDTGLLGFSAAFDYIHHNTFILPLRHQENKCIPYNNDLTFLIRLLCCHPLFFLNMLSNCHYF